jgi:uncharacterized damage-inducible protein DinB
LIYTFFVSIEAVFLDFSCRKLEQMAARIAECVASLTEEQIWARWSESSNAVGNLVLHLSGNVRQWLVSGVGGLPDVRLRDAEFTALSGDLGVLQDTVREAVAVLRRLPLERLGQRVVIQGFDLTVLEAVYHVVEHFSGHTFQIILLTKAHTERGFDFYGYLRGDDHAGETP